MISRRSFLDGLLALGVAAALVGAVASETMAATPEAVEGAAARNHRRARPNTFWSRRARRRAKIARHRRAAPKQ